MSAPTEIYWPPGWSRARLVHAEQMEILDLPEAELEQMYSSLRAVLGPAGFKALGEEMSANYHARLAAESEAAPADASAAQLSPEMRAPFLATLRKLRLDEQGEWGWVAFRTVATGATGEEEAAFQRRFDALIEEAFEAYAAQGVDEVREAQKRFKIMWVTEPELIGASEAQVAQRYRQMLGPDWSGVSVGLAHSACLLLDESCVRSVLDAEIPRPRTRDKQRVMPFVRAIGSFLGEEGGAGQLPEGERASFNVAIQALVDEFFIVVGGGVLDVGQVGACVNEGQVWCSSAGRFGIFTPS